MKLEYGLLTDIAIAVNNFPFGRELTLFKEKGVRICYDVHKGINLIVNDVSFDVNSIRGEEKDLIRGFINGVCMPSASMEGYLILIRLRDLDVSITLQREILFHELCEGFLMQKYGTESETHLERHETSEYYTNVYYNRLWLGLKSKKKMKTHDRQLEFKF